MYREKIASIMNVQLNEFSKSEHWAKNITFLEPWQPSSTAPASCATDRLCQGSTGRTLLYLVPTV